MSLLEKAHQKKQGQTDEKQTDENNNEQPIGNHPSLLEKAKQKKQAQPESKQQSEEPYQQPIDDRHSLLEKAKQKKQPHKQTPLQHPDATEKTLHEIQSLLERVQQKKYATSTPEPFVILQETVSPQKSLLEKAQQKKQKPHAVEKPLSLDQVQLDLPQPKEGVTIEVIDEQEGFGWKQMGKRRIVFDHTVNDYRYEVIEPELTQDEYDIKKELSHLFKMLADIDTFDMTREEKEKLLLETIENIIEDNNIQFDRPRRTHAFVTTEQNKDEEPKQKKWKQKGFKRQKKDKEKSKKQETAHQPNEVDKIKQDEVELEETDQQHNQQDQQEKLQQEEAPRLENEQQTINQEQTKQVPTPEQEPQTEQPETTETKENSSDEQQIKEEKKPLLAIFKKRDYDERPPQLDEHSKDKIYYHLFRDFLGYGRIDILMNDGGIEDISCDGPDTPIFLHHRKFESIETNIHFGDELELNSFVVRLCQVSGQQISIYSPIIDGKLPDGSRLQATLARTITKGSTFTIRKFKEDPLTPIDLIKFKSMSIDMAAYFWMTIEHGASILFCGGTASGKTSALNALLLFVPGSHKIVSIEDTREVNIPHKNWIAGTTRKGFATTEDSKTGKDIDMFDLIRAALRQRPRVIIVGEVRGREAYSLFQAMATGHTAYATVHASTIHTLIQRLENPPISLPRALLTSLDVIVFQNAVNIGGKMVRRMTSVTEIIKLDSDTNQLIFMAPFTWVSKTDDRFESSRTSKILNQIKQQNDWTDEDLEQELHNRRIVLEWMVKNDIHDYKDFGHIVEEYRKFPNETLEKIMDLIQQEETTQQGEHT